MNRIAVGFLLSLGLTASPLRAQLVADGATATLANVTNTITGTVTVGTNGSFTLLTLADNALLTNSVHGVIGLNASAQSNEVQLISPTTRWLMGNNLLVGSNGAFNRLVVSNGAFLNNNNGLLGNGVTSSNNFALVTGGGSLWTNRLDLTVGEFGRDNQLIVSNGARVVSRLGTLGLRAGSSNNLVVVTGSGSSWTNHLGVTVGVEGNGNRLVIEAGGQVGGGNSQVGGSAGAGNEVLVTGPGSLWSSRTDLAVGLNPPNNRLVVSNGAAVTAGNNGRVGVSTPATGNVVVVTGAGSLWSNQFDLFVGEASGNRMEVHDGGRVVSSNTYVGLFGSNNLALVTGSGSVWSNRAGLFVGFNGAGNRLVVSNGGFVVSSNAFLGYASGASNNSALVIGAGSVWSNRNELTVGSNSPGNRVEVRDGARVFVNDSTYLGRGGFSTSNSILVSGPGSLWTNGSGSIFHLGFRGNGNQLTVSNGARMLAQTFNLGSVFSHDNQALITGPGTLLDSLQIGVGGRGNRVSISDGASFLVDTVSVGNNGSSRDNELLVTGPGSLWRSHILKLGTISSGHRLVLTNGGEFHNSTTPGLINPQEIIVGEDALSTNNRVVVHGGTLRAANANGDATLDVRRGTNVLNAGLIDVDVLLLTNTLSRFEFNGGTLVTRGAVISNDATFTVGNAGNLPAVWDVRTGVSNHFVADLMVVGSVAPFCELIHTNGAFLTNSEFTILGVNVASRSNRATLAGPASRWWLGRGIAVGDSSSDNRLTVSNGASLVTADRSFIGIQVTSSNNEAIVSGSGTSWTGGPNGLLQLGSAGQGNRLVVSAGGHAEHGAGILGVVPSSSNNLALITGPGSLWNILDEMRVGESAQANQLVVSNGATVLTGGLAFLGADTSASRNSALVTDPGTSWLVGSNLFVGSNGAFNRLTVANGARLENNFAAIGTGLSSSNNLVVVTGSGSVWTNADTLIVGRFGRGNRLMVEEGARLESRTGMIGETTTSGGNELVVSGAGSTWRVENRLTVGGLGSLNRLVITNGGRVMGDGVIGFLSPSSNNEVVVTGVGSSWTGASPLQVGSGGGGNRLVIRDGAEVIGQPSGVTIGVTSSSLNNRLVVDGGSLRLLNPFPGLGDLDVRRGTNVLNAGLIECAQLLLTNGTLGKFEFNGGTLSARSSRISIGPPLVVGNGVNPATFILAGNGTHDMTGTLGLIVTNHATLTGNGTLLVQLQVRPGATLSPGVPIGKISVNTAPFLSGATVMEVSKNGSALTNDEFQVTGTLTYGGSLTVTNLGPTALAAGDTFQLFSATAYAGSFGSLTLPPLPSGLGWTNKLLVDGSIAVVAISPPGFSAVSLSGTNLILAGTNGPPNANYSVLAATNVALPLSNWLSIATNQFDSSGGFSFTNAIAPGIPQRFFQLLTP